MQTVGASSRAARHRAAPSDYGVFSPPRNPGLRFSTIAAVPSSAILPFDADGSAVGHDLSAGMDQGQREAAPRCNQSRYVIVRMCIMSINTLAMPKTTDREQEPETPWTFPSATTTAPFAKA
jgi:hypothetical protein